jgi:hypothetical protein
VGASRRSSKKSNQGGSDAPSPARRRVAVLVSLVGVLTLTSALLLALAPAPLRPQATQSLLAFVDAPQSFDVLFDSTTVPVNSGRWQNIYIHQSGSVSGSAQTLADSTSGLPDHFVIGNGDGCADGEIQVGQRWTQQLAPGVTPGANYIDGDCISICLIGDFDLTQPTPTQQRRLIQLVGALRSKLRINPEHVYFYDGVSSAAGVGRYFPTRDFRAQIAP